MICGTFWLLQMQLVCSGLAGVCTCLRASSGPRCAVANATGICSKSMNQQATCEDCMRPRDCHGKATGGVHIVTFEANSSTIPSTDNIVHIVLAVFGPKMHAVGTFCNCPCKYCYSSSSCITICSFGVKTWHWKHHCLWTSFGDFWIRSWPSLSGQRSSGTPRLKNNNLGRSTFKRGVESFQRSTFFVESLQICKTWIKVAKCWCHVLIRDAIHAMHNFNLAACRILVQYMEQLSEHLAMHSSRLNLRSSATEQHCSGIGGRKVVQVAWLETSSIMSYSLRGAAIGRSRFASFPV